MRSYRVKYYISAVILLIFIVSFLLGDINYIAFGEHMYYEETYSGDICLVIINLENKGFLIIEGDFEAYKILASKFIIKPKQCWGSIEEVAEDIYETLHGLADRLINVGAQDIESIVRAIKSARNITSIRGNIVIEVKYEDGFWKVIVYPFEIAISKAEHIPEVTSKATIPMPITTPRATWIETSTPTRLTETEGKARAQTVASYTTQSVYEALATPATEAPISHINRYVALGIASIIAVIVYFIAMKVLSSPSA